MQITIEILDSYANGDDFTRTEAVVVDPPRKGANLNDWAIDTLFPFAGQDGVYSEITSFHEITVLGCVDRPELVGESFDFG